MSLIVNRPKSYVVTALLAAVTMPAAIRDSSRSAGDRFTGRAVVDLLAGKTVSGKLGEECRRTFHCGGTATEGDLFGCRLGHAHLVDPTKTVGKWSISDVCTSSSVMAHEYGGGASCTWAVW